MSVNACISLEVRLRLQESVLSFHHVRIRDLTQADSLCPAGIFIHLVIMLVLPLDILIMDR